MNFPCIVGLLVGLLAGFLAYLMLGFLFWQSVDVASGTAIVLAFATEYFLELRKSGDGLDR